MSSTVAEGGCFCGAIRYRASGKPANTMLCHCRSCRRVAAAPVVGWITFPAAQFELLRGLTYHHRDDVGFIDITTCSLDDPDLFPPTHHSWLSDDLSWIRFGDGLPTFRESRPK